MAGHDEDEQEIKPRDDDYHRLDNDNVVQN